MTLGEAKRWLEMAEALGDDPHRVAKSWASPSTEREYPKPHGYLQWVPAVSMDALVWDKGEKFYDYVEWLKFARNVLRGDYGIELDGQIHWTGEDTKDVGTITIKGDDITVSKRDQGNSLAPLTMDKLGRMALDAATRSEA
jgi:hypothetical protein